MDGSVVAQARDSLFTSAGDPSAELSTMLLRWGPEGRCAASWITSGTVSGDIHQYLGRLTYRGGCAVVFSGMGSSAAVNFKRPTKQGWALPGRNPTRDDQVDGAPLVCAAPVSTTGAAVFSNGRLSPCLRKSAAQPPAKPTFAFQIGVKGVTGWQVQFWGNLTGTDLDSPRSTPRCRRQRCGHRRRKRRKPASRIAS